MEKLQEDVFLEEIEMFQTRVSKLHVVAVENDAEGIIKAEDNNGRTLTLDIADLVEMFQNGLQVTYEESDDVVEAMKDFSVKYISVETFADGGQEHDLYEHNVILEGGKVEMDTTGKFIKSYKREASAVKFAKTLSKDVRVF